VCALVVFFPITINVAAGVRGIPQAWRDLFAALRATRAETLLKLEIPGALPMILAGARIGATLSVIGAVVGEFLSSTSGLGFLVKQGAGLYDTPLVMLGVVCIMLVALGLYGSVRLVERVTRMV
jgi:NitT/TauT family transport system permease protein